jgi:DNA polymerase I-like protein with 3'-5' exonuclease and polymerase domains
MRPFTRCFTGAGLYRGPPLLRPWSRLSHALFSADASPSPSPEAADGAPEPLPPLPSWEGLALDGVTLVRTVAEARRVAAQVESVSAADPRVVHAWDTEVVGIDLDSQSPVGHGQVICASFFSGPGVDYGSGPRVWVDAYGEEGDAVLRAFGGVLGSAAVRKVWHNYGFDRHVLFNHGIDARGFSGDTMHMARLQNTARLDKATGGGYSLAALARLLLDAPPKVPLLELFGRARKKKNGEDSKVRELPPLTHVQRAPDPAVRAAWVRYSVLDAELTWRLHARLAALLRDAPWRPDPACFRDVQFDGINALALAPGTRDTEAFPPNLLELYQRVLAPFGECLTDMERAGVALDLGAIRAAGEAAERERTATIERFREWAMAFTGNPDMRFFNVHSDMQKAQLLFGLPRVLEEVEPGKAPAGGGDDGEGLAEDALVDVVDALPAAPQRRAPRGGRGGGGGAGGEEGPPAAAAAAAVGGGALPPPPPPPPPRRGRPRGAAPAALDGGDAAPPGAPAGAASGPRGGSAPPLSRAFSGSARRGGEPGWSIGLESTTSDSDSERALAAAALASASSEDSEGDEVARRGAPPALGEPLGPTGFLRRVPGVEEDVCAEYEFETENTEAWVEPGKAKAKKKRPFFVPSLLLPVTERTPKGRASGTAAAIRKLVGKAPEAGPACAYLLSRGAPPDAAREGAARIGDLLTISAIDTVVETFLKPLEASASTSAASRVHCSLNLNTETGRLSARRPNLQNQPSLERDRFQIRRAFVAPRGRKLLVADYGQLELRVLAHLTDCASMIAAFEAGGDFHSRTAMGMYPYVRAAVVAGDVALEGGEEGGGGGGGGAPAHPLLKDRFKEERRKAKILNFSIAYGKTAFGLSKDWGVSMAEAEATVAAWYADRPEVLAWQQDTRDRARRTGSVATMLGRHRNLPGINTRRLAGHAERAAINTPIQGSAADIVMCAMLRVREDALLERLGFRMVLQVHDELVMEGPEEGAEEALARLVAIMERPFDAPLRVALTVDGKAVRSWGDAK